MNRIHSFADNAERAMLGTGESTVTQRAASKLVSHLGAPLGVAMEETIDFLSDALGFKEKQYHKRRQQHFNQRFQRSATMRGKTQTRGAGTPTPSNSKNTKTMPGPKRRGGFRKKVAKEVKKDIRKIVKQKRGTRYRAAPAMRFAGRRGRGRGRSRAVYTVGRSQTKVFAPPVAMGFVKSETNAFRFGPGRRPGCMKMHGKQYLGGIYVYADGTHAWPVLLTQDRTATASGGAVTQFNVMPQNSFYFGNPVFTLTQLFERFQMATRLTFKTVLGTSTPGSLKFAYYDDPIAFYTSSNKQGDALGLTPFPPVFTDAPTASDMASIQTLVEGSIWKDFSTGWSYRQKNEEMKYVPSPTYSVPMSGLVYSTIDMRQSIEGTWIIGGNTLGLGNTGQYTKIGELWCTYMLELCDIMSNTPQNAPTLRAVTKASDHADKSNHLRLRKLEELLHVISTLPSQEVKETKARAVLRDDPTIVEVFDPISLRMEQKTYPQQAPSLEEEVKSLSEDDEER